MTTTTITPTNEDFMFLREYQEFRRDHSGSPIAYARWLHSQLYSYEYTPEEFVAGMLRAQQLHQRGYRATFNNCQPSPLRTFSSEAEKMAWYGVPQSRIERIICYWTSQGWLSSGYRYTLHYIYRTSTLPA